ncbi:MAG: hypothetical protein Ct9H300mP11_33340 [Chloroflexota bacterium]|nr:MAG: hypothetical protein Ct9H300mP11_33340 [Chloroflexota bacterium]
MSELLRNTVANFWHQRISLKKAPNVEAISRPQLTSLGARLFRENGTFKSADELRAIYGDKGIDGDRETISYCRIGERSSHTWFVLTQLLGHSNVRNYDGSWTEWGSIVGAPIEK